MAIINEISQQYASRRHRHQSGLIGIGFHAGQLNRVATRLAKPTHPAFAFQSYRSGVNSGAELPKI